jgi:hypothetical protein
MQLKVSSPPTQNFNDCDSTIGSFSDLIEAIGLPKEVTLDSFKKHLKIEADLKDNVNLELLRAQTAKLLLETFLEISSKKITIENIDSEMKTEKINISNNGGSLRG